MLQEPLIQPHSSKSTVLKQLGSKLEHQQNAGTLAGVKLVNTLDEVLIPTSMILMEEMSLITRSNITSLVLSPDSIYNSNPILLSIKS